MNNTSKTVSLIICSLALLITFPLLADNTCHDNQNPARKNKQDNHSFDTKFRAAKESCEGAQDCNKPASKDRPERQRPERQHSKEVRQQKVFPTKIHPAPRAEPRDHHRPPTYLGTPITREVKNGSTRPRSYIKHPRHRITYSDHIRPDYRYIRGPRYNTRYISPLPIRHHKIGHRINVLPRYHVRIIVGGLPYFYYTGVFYRPYGYNYIVVSAPIGAFVRTLPVGFVAFNIGLSTYYHVNDTYYLWDENRAGYLVVAKPAGATEAMKKATSGRLMVYPNKNQSEKQQARDRYECHRWAVTESGIDPSLEEQEFSTQDSDNYQRAIAACLEGRDYTVK